MQTIKFLAMFAVLVALFGCSDGDDPVSTLEVEATLLTAVVVRGGDIQAQLTLRNPTAGTIVLRFGDGCQTDSELTDAAGQVMSPFQVCTMATSEIVIPPYSEVERHARIGTVYDALEDYPYGVDMVPAGEYRFRPYVVGYSDLAEVLTVTVIEP